LKNKSENSKFVPYTPASVSLPELTVTALILGVILAVVIGAANAYMGLKIGLVTGASIPAAVISMAILRVLFKRKSILENNIVQTITTAGEGVATGAVFTIPAFFMWHLTPSQGLIMFIVLTGGFLGVFMMIPLRQLLIVKEHETLPYPEGTACAEVLKSGETGGTSAKTVVSGFVLGGLFKSLGDGFLLFKTEIETKIGGIKNAVIGADIYPSLLGVGFLIGPRIAGQMFAGGALAWLVLIPMISFFGGTGLHALAPATEPISKLDAWGIWNSYIRYIGAGAVATGGLISLIRSLPTIFHSLIDTVKGLKQKQTDGEMSERTNRDIRMKWVMAGILVLIAIIAFAPATNVGLIGAVCVAIFGFLFVTVASRTVGLVGTSTFPVSGMTIATLLVVTTVFKITGLGGQAGMIAALTVSAIVCTALAVAGDISQDLKTGYLVGGTPWKQQLAMMVGVVAAGLTIGFVLIVLNQAYGLGSAALPAPKAVLMKMIIEGIMANNLPWDLILMGAAAAIVFELLGANSLTVSVGIYLPIHTGLPIVVGGAIRGLIEYFTKNKETKKTRSEAGTLFASGLIAGESLVGVIIAIFIWFKVKMPSNVVFQNSAVSLVLFIGLAVILFLAAWRIKNNSKKERTQKKTA
jgi:putative OPT family oligopeptide transporter